MNLRRFMIFLLTKMQVFSAFKTDILGARRFQIRSECKSSYPNIRLVIYASSNAPNVIGQRERKDLFGPFKISAAKTV